MPRSLSGWGSAIIFNYAKYLVRFSQIHLKASLRSPDKYIYFFEPPEYEVAA